MPYSLTEVKQILRYHLTRAEAVVSLVGARVMTGHDRDTEAATRAYPVAILEFRGGQEFTSAPVVRRQLFVYGYSHNSQDEATRVYEACAAVIRQGGGLPAPPDENGDPSVGSCVYAVPGDSVAEGWNPQAGAWFARGGWLVWQMG